MLRSQTSVEGATAAVNTQPGGELCRNACGFYGNKIWDGFCSKCYREVYQQARQIQETYDDKLSVSSSLDGTPPSSIQSSPSFANFQEKRRSNNSIRNPFRQLIGRPSIIRSSTSSPVPTSNDETNIEMEAASKYLDVMTTDDARIDIKNQVKSFANAFNKKCSNKNIPIETLIQDYGQFKDALKKRIQTNAIYRGENEDLLLRVRDYVERVIFSRNYRLIFERIATVCEEKDLAIQRRITSLHWVTTHMLDTVLNENNATVADALYRAINALIELDPKTIPQEKINSIMQCKRFIEEAIRASSSNSGINADSFLPALIYTVLKAKPPRLHSNIQFLSSFSQPSGEELYYLANLDSAVRFIELLQAEHLGLSSDDFSLYMRGQPVQPSKCVSLFENQLSNDSNTQQIRKNFTLFHELDHHCEKFDENLVDFNRRLTQTMTDIRELLNGTYARFPYMEKIPQLIDLDVNDISEDVSQPVPRQERLIDIFDQSSTENDQLPAPLAPEKVQPQN